MTEYEDEDLKEEDVNCSVCGTECVKDPDCLGNWLCPDKNCSVHLEK